MAPHSHINCNLWKSTIFFFEENAGNVLNWNVKNFSPYFERFIRLTMPQCYNFEENARNVLNWNVKKLPPYFECFIRLTIHYAE